MAAHDSSPRTLLVASHIRVPLAELVFTYARSSGPGGQNVNKVASKALLRWNVLANVSLPEAVRSRFVDRFGARLTTEGELLIASQRFRDQQRNAADCLERLRQMLASVATAPKKRRPTRPTRASLERRREQKRAQSRKKQGRRRPHASDD